MICMVRGGRAARRAAVVGTLVLAVVPWATSGAARAATASPGAPVEWGSNSYGQLGNGATSTSPSAPAAVPLSDVVDIDGGREHVVALTSAGAVYTWGSNQEGQIGNGGTTNRPTPTPVTVPCAGGAVTAVEAGHNSTLALCANGTVWAWGLNSDGQLGDGTRTTRRTPVQVRTVTDAVAIAAGRDMSYAIRANGTLLAWGDNAYGEMGDGTTTDRLAPVAVTGLTNVVGIAGGRDHAVALRGDGSVWAFGANAYGQLGDGTLTNRTTPVPVTAATGTLGGAAEVDAGAHHSYALLASGGVVSWGRNYRAELGDGTLTTRTHAVAVHGVAGAVSIGAGRDSGVAVLGDGTVRTWGHNLYGQLGDGTTTNRTSAVTVPGVSGATKAAGGGSEYLGVVVGSGPPPPPPPPTPQPPVAAFTYACAQLSCDFDGRGSTDPDSTTPLTYSWDFSDTGTADTATPTHAFGSSATYPVTLKVTDADGLTNSSTQQVTVSDAPPPPPATLTLRGVRTYDGNSVRPTVAVPAGIQPGDRLVLFATTNRLATATTPAGWTLRSSVVDGTDLKSWVYTRAVPAGGAGTSVAVAMDATSKTNLSLLAYAGAADAGAVVGVNEPGSTALHRSPAATVASAGSTVVSYWADKPAAAHGWTLLQEVTAEASGFGTGGGLLTSVVGDSSGVGSGTWPGATANAGTSSAKAVAWTVVLPPAP